MAEKKHNTNDQSADFVRLLSHQMKAPVHAVQSLLQAIEEGHGDEVPAAVREALDRAVIRAREASQIVDDLLEYESYENRRKDDAREFEIVGLVSDLALRFSLSAAAKDVAVDVSLPPNLAVFATGSRVGFEHAVRNLLDNAVKYSPPLGRVEVALLVDTAGGRAHVSISDTGEGIPSSEIEKLFTPFFRSKTMATKTAGTGLGLAIAGRIVEAHGGSIEVSSEEGSGTTFTIVLPYLRLEQIPEKSRQHRKVVVIGGVTSGPKTASRLRRLDEDLDITIIERNEFLSYPGCQLPYFISDAIGSSHDTFSSAYHSLRTAHFFDTMKNINVLNMTVAEAVDRNTKSVTVRREKDDKVFQVPYDVLVLATGSLPSVPSIPGAAAGRVFPLHSLEDAKRIKERLRKSNAQDVMIIGGGLIGISMVQSLLESGARVTVVEKEPSILSSYFDADFSRKIENELTRKAVKVATRTEITSISSVEERLAAHATGRILDADFIVLSSGMRPNTDLALTSGLELGPTGGIRVDEHFRTSDPSIFAIGDCAETRHLLTGQHEYWPLGSISMKMGHMVADVIAGREAVYRGSLGTVLLGCLDLRFARTGLTTVRARKAGFDPESFILSGPDRPSYVAGAKEIYLKVIADRRTRKILGAQAFGRGEISSKISLCASAITSGMTTDDLFSLDIGHAPEFNHPIDVVQSTCTMVNNKIDGLVKTISASDLDEKGGRYTLVAIVAPEHSVEDLIPGSIELNPENLRKNNLPFGENEEVVLYSRTSMEAYQAYRYLVQRGFGHLHVLEGGFLFWAE